MQKSQYYSNSYLQCPLTLENTSKSNNYIHTVTRRRVSVHGVELLWGIPWSSALSQSTNNDLAYAAHRTLLQDHSPVPHSPVTSEPHSLLHPEPTVGQSFKKQHIHENRCEKSQEKCCSISPTLNRHPGIQLQLDFEYSQQQTFPALDSKEPNPKTGLCRTGAFCFSD